MTAKRSAKAAPKRPSRKAKTASARSSKAPSSSTLAEPALRGTARASTKHAQALSLLRAPDGITVPDLAQALSWQAHSVRGFLSGTVVKKLKLELQKHRTDGQPTRYSIAG